MRLLVLLLAALLLTAGCGDDTERESPPQASQFEGCTTDNFARTGEPVGTLRSYDRPVRVRLVPHDAEHCPDSLIARSGSGVTGSDVGDLDLDPATARVVSTPGRAGDLLLVESHPEGATTQPHLFAAGGQEVRSDDGPLLPAVDTGRRTPLDATCARGGRLVVVTAKAHQPPGIVLAWDVTRTTYVVDGDRARVATEAVVSAVADPTLRRQHPELYDGRLLENC